MRFVFIALLFILGLGAFSIQKDLNASGVSMVAVMPVRLIALLLIGGAITLFFFVGILSLPAPLEHGRLHVKQVGRGRIQISGDVEPTDLDPLVRAALNDAGFWERRKNTLDLDYGSDPELYNAMLAVSEANAKDARRRNGR